MKKLLSIVLVLMLALNIGMTAFAVTNDNGLSVTKLSGSSILVTTGDQRGILTFKETVKGTTFTVKELTSGDVEGYFYINKVDDTIYSSYTGNTISVSDTYINNDVMPMAVGDVFDTNTYDVSYADLAELVLPTSSQLSIIGAMLATVVAITGVAIAAVPSVILAWLGTSVWDTIRAGITDQIEDSGLRVVVDTIEIEKHQGGRIVKGYKYEVTSVSLY